MSFNTHMTFTNELPSDCYAEDFENYDELYCENNFMEENQNVYPLSNQNITDIQLNNKQVTPQPVKLSKKYQNTVVQNVSPPQCCYIRTCPPSTKVARPYSNCQPQFYGIHQCCPLSSISQQDTTYDTVGYRTASAALQHNITPHYSYRNIQNAENSQAYQKPIHTKKYPVTAPTPKYYRKAISPSLYKRPSALCLPVASQPDPAVHRRSKRQSSNESTFETQQAMVCSTEHPVTRVQKKKPSTAEALHKMDSEGDVTFKGANLEQMLQQLEICSPQEMIKNKNDIAKLSKFFKPKLPPSLKNKEEFTTVKPAENPPECENPPSPSPEAQEYEKTRDSLDKLLQQLKKCELPSSNEAIENHEFQNYHESREIVGNDNRQIDVTANRTNKNADEDTQKRNLKDMKSFNYQDITDQISRTQEEIKGCTDSARESTTTIQEITKRLSSSVSSSSGKPRSVVPKPTLDDHCALELHRSKSYIVNLIDRALSKELGTIPSERTKKQFDDMTPRKAIEVMNRHSYCKPEKALSVEITSALTDSIISTATAPIDSQVHSSSSKKICCCTTEEPTYIKQLKQLRWGHLKHIQREVRRLEDLERFLDSCSITTIPEM